MAQTRLLDAVSQLVPTHMKLANIPVCATKGWARYNTDDALVLDLYLGNETFTLREPRPKSEHELSLPTHIREQGF